MLAIFNDKIISNNHQNVGFNLNNKSLYKWETWIISSIVWDNDW